MIWHKELYLGENAAKNKEKLIQKIESGKTPVNVFLLILPSGRKNQMEIIPGWEWRFWCREKERPVVIGLACGRREAFQLVQRITGDVYEKTGGAEVRRYFLGQ